MSQLDADAIYALASPPAYEPWPIYGAFLMAVATGQAPLMFDNAAPIPGHVRRTADIVYKTVGGREIALDLYRSVEDDSPRPLVVYIHGGYWKAGSRSVHAQQGTEFVDMGYTMAAIDYRLSGEAPFPAAVLDIRDGIRWLTDNAAEHAIDPARIVLCGSSAGGHLAAFMGLSANSPGRDYGDGLDAKCIKAVISMYGMHDLTIDFHHEHPFTTQFLGTTYAEDPARYVEASPVAHVDPSNPPVLLMHGTLDGSVPVRHSDLLARRLEAAGVPFVYDRINGWAHCMSWFSPLAERTLWQIYHFLKQHVPSADMVK